MLTIAIILVVLWALGLGTAYTLGGLIHALLALALILFIVNVMKGRAMI